MFTLKPRHNFKNNNFQSVTMKYSVQYITASANEVISSDAEKWRLLN